MCGIAGILYKNAAGRDTGKALIDMLDGCQHRGPDSTGFALYEEAHEDQLRLRFFVGEGAEAESAVQRIQEELAKQNAELLEDEIIGNNYRVSVRFTGNLQHFSYAMEHNAKVISIGASLEIVKDVGSAHDVDDRYHVSDFAGICATGEFVMVTVDAEGRPTPIAK